MAVSAADKQDWPGYSNESFMGVEYPFGTGNISCVITNAEYNGSLPDDRLIPMPHPEEMLTPERQNPWFIYIVITHSITFFLGIVVNVAAVSVMLGDRKSRNATNLFLVRFVVIVFPMRSRSYCTLSNCRKAIVVVWLIAMFLSLPVILVTDVYSAIYCNEEISVTAYYCAEEGMPIMVYEFIILFAAPGILMVICYTYVIRELWKSTQNISYLTQAKSIRSTSRLRENTSSANGIRSQGNTGMHFPRFCRDHQPMKVHQGNGNHVGGGGQNARNRPAQPARAQKGEDAKKSRKQVIKMLILVIVLFLAAWGPKVVLNLILKWDLVQEAIGYTQWMYSCRVIFGLAPFAHSCINPLIYSFMSKNFRRSMQRQMHRCCSFFGCKRLKLGGTNRNCIPLRSTARTQNVDLLYSSNYCPLADGLVVNAHTEIESVSVI